MCVRNSWTFYVFYADYNGGSQLKGPLNGCQKDWSKLANIINSVINQSHLYF